MTNILDQIAGTPLEDSLIKGIVISCNKCNQKRTIHYYRCFSLDEVQRFSYKPQVNYPGLWCDTCHTSNPGKVLRYVYE